MGQSQGEGVWKTNPPLKGSIKRQLLLLSSCHSIFSLIFYRRDLGKWDHNRDQVLEERVVRKREEGGRDGERESE